MELLSYYLSNHLNEKFASPADYAGADGNDPGIVLENTVPAGLSMTNATTDIRIIPLADAIETIPVLERWFIAEWAPYYGPEGMGNSLDDLMACCNRHELPLALVALDGKGNVLGTAALKDESVGSKAGQSPWLAAFLVGPKHRRRGVGTRLVAAIEQQARRLDFDALYVSTDAAENIVKNRGWSPLDTVPSLRGPITVYRLDMKPE
jgi:predicted N-acetyltransferase YhbS